MTGENASKTTQILNVVSGVICLIVALVALMFTGIMLKLWK
jgi:hypothetical protein